MSELLLPGSFRENESGSELDVTHPEDFDSQLISDLEEERQGWK
jgi:hypothetical protein